MLTLNKIVDMLTPNIVLLPPFKMITTQATLPKHKRMEKPLKGCVDYTAHAAVRKGTKPNSTRCFRKVANAKHFVKASAGFSVPGTRAHSRIPLAMSSRTWRERRCRSEASRIIFPLRESVSHAKQREVTCTRPNALRT